MPTTGNPERAPSDAGDKVAPAAISSVDMFPALGVFCEIGSSTELEALGSDLLVFDFFTETFSMRGRTLLKTALANRSSHRQSDGTASNSST